MKKLYIVTGACGHLGNTVVKALLAQGEAVRALALPNESTKALDGLEVELVRGDVRDKASLQPLFVLDQPCEVIVIHTAGIVTVASKYVQRVVDVNVTGTQNLIEVCRENHVSRLVYTSSVHALPELPGNQTIQEVSHFDRDAVFGLYAKTKAQATQSVLDSGLDAVVVHPSGIIGPNDYGNGHLTQLIIDFLNGSLTAGIRGGYDFVDVRDVADGVIAAAQRGRSGECYILSNRFYPVIELLDLLHEISGKRRIRTVLPKWFAKFSAPLAELYYKLLRQSPLFTRYTLYTLYSNANFSHQKADRELGYTTRDIRTTLADTIDFLREQGRVKK